MIVGVTGGIATGKSTVTNYLKTKGYFVIDCDELVHDAYKIGSDVYNKIISLFNLNKGFEIDRSEISKIVFNDKEKLRELEAIIHPYVFKQIDLELKKNNDKIRFISMPLLFEVGYNELVDKVITVSVNKTTQVLRLMKRDNIDYDYALLKINSQMDLVEKINKSDYVIDNSYSIDETYIAIDNVIKDLEKMVE